VESVTSDGVGLRLGGVAVVTVAPPRRFAKRQDPVDERVRDIVCRHLGAVIGTLSAQDLLVHRKRLIDQTLAASRPEVAKLGAELIEVTPKAVDFDEESEFYKQLKLAEALVARRAAEDRGTSG
jgi:hypothetical protein